MIKNRKRTALVVALGLTLLAQLLNPTRAYADGETPSSPSDAAETATVPPTEVIVAETPTPEPTALSPDKPGVDVIPIELLTRIPADAVGTGTPPPPAESPESPDKPAEQVASTPDPVEATPSASIGSPRVPALGDVLRDIPENTNVIVLDDIGKLLPLASQEAAQVITESDPIWCPAGQAPTPGLNGCTSSYATLGDLVTNVGATIAGSGTIWITNGPVLDAGPITIDGSSYSTWANYSLILQGGWSGISGDTSIVSNSVFSVPVTIANWNNDLTLSNITSTSSIGIINDPSRTTPNEIGNVTIESVTARHLNVTTNSAGNSISIYNSNFSNDGQFGTGEGAYIDGWLNSLNIYNSHFDDSNGHGLVVYNSWSGVNITDSTFDRNGRTGAVFVYSGNLAIHNASFTGNFGDGMSVSQGNTVAINNSTFDGNTGTGLTLTQLYNVDIAGSIFSGNGGDSLSISNIGTQASPRLNGGISISSSYANNVIVHDVHLQYGSLWAENNNFDNLTIQDSTFQQPLTGSIFVSTNNSSNIWIDHVTVDQSLGFGLGIVTNGGNVTINNSVFKNTLPGSNVFAWGDGADIFTNGGNITINQSQFTDNTYDGLFAVNAGDITINGSTFSFNGVNGLNVAGAGNVTIANSTFSDSGSTGASIGNTANITLSGGTFNNNDVGLAVYCVTSVNLNRPLTIFSGNRIPIEPDPSCPIDIVPPQPLTLLQPQGKPFKLDCATGLNRYVVRLANGDRGEIFCPVDGEASIDRVDNTILPASLPAGYTYASAFDVEIIQNGKPISWISEGGYITASFLAQNSPSGNVYSILYWDQETGTWVPLKDLLLNAEGKPEVLPLFPGTDGDRREIRSGVNLVIKNGETRVEVSTNFPGIFVLAQH